jgi:hypothetical protein
MHWELFPIRRKVTSEMIKELSNILVHAMTGELPEFRDFTQPCGGYLADSMTSPTSTAPYSVPEMERMLSLVQHIKGMYLRMFFSVNPSQRKKATGEEAVAPSQRFDAGHFPCSFGMLATY